MARGICPPLGRAWAPVLTPRARAPGPMLVSEGGSRHLRTEAFPVLDENTGRATTLAWTGCYSPVTPSDGLHFDYDTEVMQQGEDSDDDDYRYYRKGGGRRSATTRSCEI